MCNDLTWEDDNVPICNYIAYVRYGNNTNAGQEPNLIIYTVFPGSGPSFDLSSAGRETDLFLDAATGSLDGDHNTIQLEGVLYREAFSFKAACNAVITIEFESGRFGSIDFDSVAIRRL